MKRIWLVVFITTLALSFLIDFLLRGWPEHSNFPWSDIPRGFALFGFVAGVVIIVISKLLGHYWLQRKEDYYDRNDRDK